jgi:hypothetical protein
MPNYRAVLLFLILTVSTAHAQSFSLPEVDNVNFFFQGGSIVGGTDVKDDPADDAGFFSQLGWGFETSFDMTKTPSWLIELAVGYDQSYFRGKLLDRYSLRGTIRDLPAISIYASHSSSFYFGFGTGLVSLNNMAAYEDGHKRFTVGGDTFDLSGKVGRLFRYERATLFFEAAYHARFISSVNYGMGASDSLPGSLYFGSLIFSVGGQISLKTTKPPATEGDIKKEAARQQRELPSVDMRDVTTRTICAGSAVDAGWIVIDDGWDPRRCGNSQSVTPNVWLIAHYAPAANPPSALEVCAFAPIPNGWVAKGERWDPMRCGHPQAVTNNVRIIGH